jgi:hypothetical protein
MFGSSLKYIRKVDSGKHPGAAGVMAPVMPGASGDQTKPAEKYFPDACENRGFIFCSRWI